jgi:hypothetical protein
MTTTYYRQLWSTYIEPKNKQSLILTDEDILYVLEDFSSLENLRDCSEAAKDQAIMMMLQALNEDKLDATADFS